jgi:allantoinase
MKGLESGDFARAWGGIASLQVHVAAVWTAARARGHGLERLARWTAEAPARLAGIEDRKGAIEPGRDADVVVFDPERRVRVEGARLEHRHKLTPYEGRELAGAVEATYVRGQCVFRGGEIACARAGAPLRARGLTA